MRSFLFCTSYINNFNQKHHYQRYKKWIDFYQDKLDFLGAEFLFLIDDGSCYYLPERKLKTLRIGRLPQELTSTCNIVKFKNNLGRRSMTDFPGWWRSFTGSILIAERYKFEKIIHIESDFFILSESMFEHIKALSTGWTTFFCEVYGFPETAIQVICQDCFDDFKNIYAKAVQNNFSFSEIPELLLPFTNIEKKFIGDRYGEKYVLNNWIKNNKSPIKIDYFGQLDTQSQISDYKLHLTFD